MKRLLVVFTVLVVFSAGTAFAQTQTGTITGKVTDPDGEALPGVTVTAESPALVQPQTRVTGPAGAYTFTALPVGIYTVRFELEGFRTVERSEIRISIGFVATVNVQLELSTVEETVTVTGESPVVDVKSTDRSYNVGEETLEDVPTGRHIWSVAETAPGVTSSNIDIGGTEGMQQYGLEAHGGSDDQKSFNIDGLKLNWPGGIGGGATMMYYDFSMFEEVAYETSILPAEVQAGGIYMNMVTNSGGNNLHADGYLYGATEDLQGDNVTDELRARGAEFGNPLDSTLDANATVGGPIVENKVWGFGAARWWRLEKVRTGVLDAEGNPTTDPNRIRNLYGKLTWQADQDNKLTLGFNNNYKDRFKRTDRGWFTADEAAWVQKQPAHSLQGQWTSVLSDSAFADVRIGRMWGVFPLEHQEGVPRNNEPGNVARQDVGTRERSVAPPFGEFLNPNDRLQINAALSYFLQEFGGGYHDFKFGYQFSDQTMERQQRANGDMSIRFNNGVPLDVFIFNTPTDARSKLRDWGVYAQDNWTIQDRVTLNLGVRVSGVRGWTPEQTSPSGTFVEERNFPEIDDIPDLQGDVAPRLGAVFDLFGDGRTAIKAGFARYYDQFGAGLVEQFNPNNFAVGVRSWTDTNGDRFPQLTELGPFQGFGGGVNRRLAEDLDTPFEDEFMVGFDRQLTDTIAFTASYFHREAKDQWGTRNLLQPPSAYSPVDVFDPFTGSNITVWELDADRVGQVDNLTTNVDALDANYDGVEFTLSRRLSDRWHGNVGVTVGEHEGGVGGFSTDFNNPNNLINQKGKISNDSTFLLKGVVSYIAPYDVHVSANFRHIDGYPLNRNLVVGGLNQGTEVIRVVPRGEFRLEDVDILDLRVGKIFEIGPHRIEGSVDFFNIFDDASVLSEVETVGASLGNVNQLVAPRLIRFGVNYRF